MTLFSNSLITANGQLMLAVALAVAGFVLLLPRPRGRVVAGGIASLFGAVVVLGAWLHQSFGQPMPDVIGSVLFGFFAGGALFFGTIFVVQRNPARGAIAFAFVILSTCGLFLLLAAPFLMAATIIIYAGAIIVTFLFVLMLSRADGPTDENDRSREPLLGTLAGFAFAGLILFTLYVSHQQTTQATLNPQLPTPLMTAEDASQLNRIAQRVAELERLLDRDPLPTHSDVAKELSEIENELESLIGEHFNPNTSRIKEGSIGFRLRSRIPSRDAELAGVDPHAVAMHRRVESLREMAHLTFRAAENHPPLASESNRTSTKQSLQQLRDEIRLLAGSGQLPARNVGTIGVTLFSEHLLKVELAGVLLLIATIGAIAISQRKGAAS